MFQIITHIIYYHPAGTSVLYYNRKPSGSLRCALHKLSCDLIEWYKQHGNTIAHTSI